ncbi:MAG: hypothetical protein IIV45_00220 [Lachnospiraceae bacterium]|nr:hypothetical protein [Lachnospiraceae bacterium]
MESELEYQLSNFWTIERRKKYEEAMKKVLSLLESFDEEYYEKKGNHIIRFTEKRLKTPKSIYDKIVRKKKKSTIDTIEEDINDLAGVRIICFDIAQIYKLACVIGKQESFEIKKVKDYVRKPKENGYQSYHIQLKVDGVKVEIQIRTILMDAWSSLDSILVYKRDAKISREITDNIEKYAKWSMRMDKMVHSMMKA